MVYPYMHSRSTDICNIQYLLCPNDFLPYPLIITYSLQHKKAVSNSSDRMKE